MFDWRPASLAVFATGVVRLCLSFRGSGDTVGPSEKTIQKQSSFRLGDPLGPQWNNWYRPRKLTRFRHKNSALLLQHAEGTRFGDVAVNWSLRR